MSEVNWGDPDTRCLDRFHEKRESEIRLAGYYTKILHDAHQLYLQDANQGLAFLDSEATNIRCWQAKAEEWFASDKNDAITATICIDFALLGGCYMDFRLHPRERIRWLELCIMACRCLGNKRREGRCAQQFGSGVGHPR